MNIINLLFTSPIEGAIVLICIVFAIGVHEAAHAYSAYWLGDITPKYQKRLTLNPLAHIDWLGLAMIAFIGFGWGRAVEVNPLNLKNQKRDMALVAFAGPLSNLVMAIIGLWVIALSQLLPGDGKILIDAMVAFVFLNLALAVFNLLPFEPLDGFKVLKGLLPYNLAYQLEQSKTISMYVLFFLILSGATAKIVLPVVDIIAKLLFSLV